MALRYERSWKLSYAHNNHYEWIESNHKVKCSPLGREVANILGYVGCGIYNAPIKTGNVDWTDECHIDVSWGQSLSNWDGRNLTQLVIECHRRMIRVTISPKSMQNLRLQFWQRHSRDRSDGFAVCLPDIEEMIRIQDKNWNRFGIGDKLMDIDGDGLVNCSCGSKPGKIFYVKGVDGACWGMQSHYRVRCTRQGCHRIAASDSRQGVITAWNDFQKQITINKENSTNDSRMD